MSNFVPIETPGGVLWVEIESATDVTSLELTAYGEKALKSFQDAASAVKANAQYLIELLKEIEPAELEITFGIKAGVEAGTPFFGLAKATGEANYKVKITWKSEEEGS